MVWSTESTISREVLSKPGFVDYDCPLNGRGPEVDLNRVLREALVDRLALSDASPKSLLNTREFKAREWDRAADWLRDSGIALYFLQRLKDTNSSEVVPPRILDRLQANYDLNRQRIASMANAFSVLNQKFNNAGVRYAVVKGFSLVPDFCLDPCLRVQSDLDYLIDEESFGRAEEIVLHAGYSWTHRVGHEVMYSPSSLRKARSEEDQFRPDVLHTIELHLGIVDTEHDLPLGERPFVTQSVKRSTWNGSTFYALQEEEGFLLQVRHAFIHLVNYWPRLSWLFEIGHFLKCKVNDNEFWARLEQTIGDNAVLRDVVVVVAELSAQIFRTPLSSTLRDWSETLRPGARVWIENYGREWILAAAPGAIFRPFSPSKLVLFLHQQFMSDEASQAKSSRVWLLHPPRLKRVVGSIRKKPLLMIDSHYWWRGLFHANSGLRYLLEVPRWRYLNRRALR